MKVRNLPRVWTRRICVLHEVTEEVQSAQQTGHALPRHGPLRSFVLVSERTHTCMHHERESPKAGLRWINVFSISSLFSQNLPAAVLHTAAATHRPSPNPYLRTLTLWPIRGPNSALARLCHAFGNRLCKIPRVVMCPAQCRLGRVGRQSNRHQEAL